jgi:hypothetical protein
MMGKVPANQRFDDPRWSETQVGEKAFRSEPRIEAARLASEREENFLRLSEQPGFHGLSIWPQEQGCLVCDRGTSRIPVRLGLWHLRRSIGNLAHSA